MSANRLGYELLKEALKLDGVKIEGVITLSKDAITVMYDGIETELWHDLNIKVYEKMNYSGKITCINCGKEMKTGSSQIWPSGSSQFRFCDCGIKCFLFSEAEYYEFKLIAEKRGSKKCSHKWVGLQPRCL